MEEKINEHRKELRRKMKRKIVEARAKIAEKYPDADVTKMWTRKRLKVEPIENRDAQKFELKKVTNGYEREQTEKYDK